MKIPKTGVACTCKRGVQRDNCPQCEGTGQVIDYAALRAARGVWRWVVVRPDATMPEGTYVLCHAAQGRDTYATEAEAQAMLDAMLVNNSHDELRRVYHCEPTELKAWAVECWPGHFDPKGIYCKPF